MSYARIDALVLECETLGVAWVSMSPFSDYVLYIRGTGYGVGYGVGRWPSLGKCAR